MISKNLQIPGLQPRISQSLEQFFLTVGQNNFVNKIHTIPTMHKGWLCSSDSLESIERNQSLRELVAVCKYWFVRNQDI